MFGYIGISLITVGIFLWISFHYLHKNSEMVSKFIEDSTESYFIPGSIFVSVGFIFVFLYLWGIYFTIALVVFWFFVFWIYMSRNF